MARFLPAGVRRTLVGFTTLAGLLLSMAQSCDAGCGSSSGASRSTVAAPRVTVTPSETSSGARYFQDRPWGGADEIRTTSTKTRKSATCTPTSRTTTSRTTTRNTHSSSSSKDKQGNNGSAFDEGYDKGYDEGYDDGYDDARRKDSGRSRHDDG